MNDISLILLGFRNKLVKDIYITLILNTLYKFTYIKSVQFGRNIKQKIW